MCAASCLDQKAAGDCAQALRGLGTIVDGANVRVVPLPSQSVESLPTSALSERRRSGEQEPRSDFDVFTMILGQYYNDLRPTFHYSVALGQWAALRGRSVTPLACCASLLSPDLSCTLPVSKRVRMFSGRAFVSRGRAHREGEPSALLTRTQSYPAQASHVGGRAVEDERGPLATGSGERAL